MWQAMCSVLYVGYRTQSSQQYYEVGIGITVIVQLRKQGGKKGGMGIRWLSMFSVLQFLFSWTTQSLGSEDISAQSSSRRTKMSG